MMVYVLVRMYYIYLWNVHKEGYFYSETNHKLSVFAANIPWLNIL